MDRLIAANSVPQAQADTAPTTGTAQFATDGNPASNIPATRWPSYQYNAIQEELMAIIGAAGIMPDRTNNAQILAALQACFSPLVGQARNFSMNVSAASSTATPTADEIAVKSSLGGLPFVLKNFSETINLATIGAGGMDAGAAPISGFVALYAIYDPATQTAGLLATNATSSVAPSVYAGDHMPAGYTASALVSVWPTNGSGQLVSGLQIDKNIYISPTTVLNTSVQQASFTSLNISGAVPKNARSVDIQTQFAQGAGGSINFSCSLAPTSSAIGSRQLYLGITSAAGINNFAGCSNIPIITPQLIYYIAQFAAGSITLGVTGYSF